MTKNKNNSSIQESLLLGFYNSFIFVTFAAGTLSLFDGSVIAYKNAAVLFTGGIVSLIIHGYFYKKRKDAKKFLIAFLIVTTLTSYAFALAHDLQYTVIFYLQYIPIVYFFLLSLRGALWLTFGHYLLIATYIIVRHDYYKESLILDDPMVIKGLVFSCVFIAYFGVYYHRAVKDAYTKLEVANNQNLILLKEIHHRVKNNLNVISSVVTLQSNATSSKPLKDALLKTKLRIDSMAMVHNTLYKQKDIATINFYDYVYNLSNLAKEIFNNSFITINIKADKITLDPKIIQSLGLIINELLSNSFKYAFENAKKGEIFIELSLKNGRYNFKYFDTGAGVNNLEDLYKKDTLGVEIIKLTARQIDADLSIKNDPKLTYTLEFEV